MTAAYDVPRPGSGHRDGASHSDAALATVVVAMVVAMWSGLAAASLVAGVGAVAAALVVRRRGNRWWWVLIVVVAALGGAIRADHAWDDVRTPDRLGPYQGWARLASDPEPRGRATQLVLEIEGERFEVWVRGRGAQHRVGMLLRGETVTVTGERRPLGGRYPDRARVRHVVGEFALVRLGADGPAAPLDRAANRVRRRIVAAAHEAMSPERAALFTGLVIGDDTRQSPQVIDEFRRAGLSHLTAVSGQNIAFVLAAAGVLIRRLSPMRRWLATIGVIAWFVVLTRMEASVLRAGVMAAWAATAFVLGQQSTPWRFLLLTVGSLAMIDPLLMWSVAFWLSAGATAGVLRVGPAVRRRLAGPAWIAEPLAVTCGAQIGVLVPSLLVFGTLAPLGIAANLLAVPVAGAVMLVGLPLAILAPALPDPLATAVLAPAAAGVAWVRTVAALAARLEPHGVVEVVVWMVQIAVVAALLDRRSRRERAAVER